jgi:hypothetical protein
MVPAEANALVADGQAPCRQDQFDISQVEAEAMIQPNRMGDDLRRKTEAPVGILVSAHAHDCDRTNPAAKLTTPPHDARDAR